MPTVKLHTAAALVIEANPSVLNYFRISSFDIRGGYLTLSHIEMQELRNAITTVLNDPQEVTPQYLAAQAMPLLWGDRQILIEALAFQQRTSDV